MVRSISEDSLILAELNLSRLQQSIVDLTDQIANGFAFLTDAYGNVVAHLDRSLVNQQVNRGDLKIFDHLRGGNRSSSGFFYRPDGIKLFSAVKVPLVDWNVVIEQDAMTLFMPVIWSAIVFVAGLCTLFGLVVYFFNRRMQHVVITPLSQFAQHLETIKRGEHREDEEMLRPPNLPLQNFEELSHLGRSFADMQSAIRKRERSLRHSEETYRNLFHNAQVGLFRIRMDDGQVLESNDQLAHMFGYASKDEFIHTYITSQNYVDPGTGEAMMDTITHYGEVENFEARFYRKDGSIFWALSSIRIYYDQGWMEGVVQDITERKEAEEAREKLQAQLNQTQKMESVGRLAGGVAHDFNNMLGVILGHTELALMQADENHDLYSDLKEIQTAATRSAEITKQLLAFARKQTISPGKIDLNKTVESMLNMLRRLIGEDIELSWLPAGQIWPVKMDPSQIDQILANLCVNARDAIDGVGKLTIESGRKTFDEEYCSEHSGFIPGDFVLLSVSDNGCGMDKDTLENLFEPFYTTKEVGKGTGLGLATIYGIVKQNNGFINVYSEPGRGSTFKIYLPRLVEEEDTDKAVPEKKTAAGGTETILLVEDEPTILRMTRMMLERNGYSVLSAATPAEAVEKANHHSGSIELLMTDVVMPEMNGRDLAGKIAGLYPGIRLLFMSGYTADVIAHQGVLDDGVAFIQKPFSMADMTMKVREVLDIASLLPKLLHKESPK